MEKINFTELKALKSGDIFYCISHGNLNSYIFVSPHPKTENLIVAIDKANYKTAVTFGINQVEGYRTVFLIGAYNSKECGKIIIDQFKDQIKSINNIYIKD